MKAVLGIFIALLIATFVVKLNRFYLNRIGITGNDGPKDRYEMLFGAAITDEQKAVKEFIFEGGDNRDEVLLLDLDKVIFGNK